MQKGKGRQNKKGKEGRKMDFYIYALSHAAKQNKVIIIIISSLARGNA